MQTEGPLRLHHTQVRSDWLDYNGHMNEAYYVLVFSHATDDFMDYVALDEDYRNRANASIYTLETHVVYLMEAKGGAPLSVDTILLGFDSKRLHLFHAMRHSETGDLLATGEHMLLHVDMAGPKAAPFPPPVMERLAAVRRAHQEMALPSQAGRSIALPAPK